MKTFQEFRQDSLNEGFMTIQQCRDAYRTGVLEGTIGLCPGCGSPNLSDNVDGFRGCVDCGHVSDQWQIPIPGIDETEGGGNSAGGGGAPTNNISGGNIAGGNGVPNRKKLEIVGPKPVDPSLFSNKIFNRAKPVTTEDYQDKKDLVRQATTNMKQFAKKADAREKRFSDSIQKCSQCGYMKADHKKQDHKFVKPSVT